MKCDIRDKWCEALRSGKYSKIEGSYDGGPGEHCVIGVLLEILGNGPRESAEKLLPFGPSRSGLVFFNDYPYHSFDDCATYIEENIPCDE